VLGGGDRQADRQVGLPHTGWAEEDDVLPALDEAELVEALDLPALDRGLEGEVEVLEGIHRGQSGGSHGGLQAPVVAQGDLGAEEALDRLGRADPAAVDAGQDRIQGLQRPGHLEIGQHGADPVATGETIRLHRPPPASRPYTSRGRRSTGTSGRRPSSLARLAFARDGGGRTRDRYGRRARGPR
jgi:hypothetical protein